MKKNVSPTLQKAISFIDRNKYTCTILLQIYLKVSPTRTQAIVKELDHRGYIYRPCKGLLVSHFWATNHPDQKIELERIIQQILL